MWVNRVNIKPGNYGLIDFKSSARLPQLTVVSLSSLTSMQAAYGTLCILFVMRGAAKITSQEGSFTLNAKQWIVLERESLPTIETNKKSLAFAIVLTEKAIEYAIASPNGLCPYRARIDRVLMRLLNSCKSTLLEHTEESVPVFRMCLKTLLHYINALSVSDQKGLMSCPGRTLTRKRQVYIRMQRARLYIEGHTDRVVRISELASLTNFSPWYFTKTFHQLFGYSPQSYAVTFRLERARSLITSSSLAVGEVAAECGFENACAFSRAFKQRFGTTASRMRYEHSGRYPTDTKRQQQQQTMQSVM